MRKLLVLISLSCCTLPVAADQLSGTLTGGYGFYGDRCNDKGQGKGCVMTFEISGEAAKALYDRIKWKPQPDACTEGVVKDTRNGMRCFKVKDEYTCDFGYSFLSNEMTDSDMSC
jgi:hypothetical protein